MKIFFDTEFHEYAKKPLLGKPINTIELISIGMINENGDWYYAVCNEFDLKAAWNKWQPRTGAGDRNRLEPKEYWLRENVLKTIFYGMHEANSHIANLHQISDEFNYKNMKKILSTYGKSRTQIAHEVKCFVAGVPKEQAEGTAEAAMEFNNPEFYAYYADYDWVVLCWLYGRMIDLPKGFPMYCKDLKQMLDDNCDAINKKAQKISPGCPLVTHKSMKENNPNYPKQENEHNAFDDAMWNRKLYYFLTNK